MRAMANPVMIPQKLPPPPCPKTNGEKAKNSKTSDHDKHQFSHQQQNPVGVARTSSKFEVDHTVQKSSSSHATSENDTYRFPHQQQNPVDLLSQPEVDHTVQKSASSHAASDRDKNQVSHQQQNPVDLARKSSQLENCHAITLPPNNACHKNNFRVTLTVA